MKISYGGAAMTESVIYNMVTTYLIFYLTTIAGIDAAIAGGIMAMAAIAQIIWNLFISYISDHCSSRMGRRRPFILIGGVFFSLSILYGISYATFYSPYLTLNGDMVEDYAQKSRIRSTTYMIGSLGTIIGSALPSPAVAFLTEQGMNPKDAWRCLAFLIVVWVMGFLLVTFFLTKQYDKPIQQAKKTKKCLAVIKDIIREYREILTIRPVKRVMIFCICLASASCLETGVKIYYLTYNVGFSAAEITWNMICCSLLGTLCVPFITKMITRFGRIPVLISAFGITTVMRILLTDVVPATSFLGTLVLMLLLKIGIGIFWQVSPEFFYDIAKYDEYRNFRKRESAITSLLNICEAFANALAGRLTGIVLQISGFAGEMAVQETGVQMGIKLLLIYIPILFWIVGIAVIFRYPITRSYYDHLVAELKRREAKETHFS